MEQKIPQVLIVAAEASSALFAQRLLEYWKSKKVRVKAFGVGSREMEKLGFECLGRSEDMAVVGAVEVIKEYSRLKKTFDHILAEVQARKPKLILLMDYPGFNLKLAKRLSPTGIPIVYYIVPQVWAWKQGRAEILRKHCRKLLLILPFEKKFFDGKRIASQFVGHPLLDEIRPELKDPEGRRIARSRRGIRDDDFVLGLMPGSRRGELERNFPVQLETAKRLKRNYPRLRILVFVAPTLELDEVRDYLDGWEEEIQLIKDEPFEMIHLADFILAASGTATLMVAMLAVPMVIMYKLNWFTAVLARLLVRNIRFFGLPNLLLNREVVPERWQSGAEPEHLVKLIEDYIQRPERREQMRLELGEISKLLGERGATARVAQELSEFLQ